MAVSDSVLLSWPTAAGTCVPNTTIAIVANNAFRRYSVALFMVEHSLQVPRQQLRCNPIGGTY
jgi:hypothetical protein